MTQLAFQNIRNLGANSNQPLITNQNDFQFFDNVTWLKGRHTIKAGGSVTLRSREILNADTIVGNFGFNNNQTSNCAGFSSATPLAEILPTPCINAARTAPRSTRRPASTWPASCSATPSSKTRNLFDAETYTETRPEYSLYLQDDFRLTNKLTVNAGLRWDVYVPWIEKDNRQSNFDEVTGRFIIASDNAVVNGVEVGRYLQTYSRARSRTAPRAGLRRPRRRPHHRPRRLRRLLELLARRHVVVEGAEPALPAVDGADDDARVDQSPRPGRPAGAPGRRPEPSVLGHDAVDLRRQLPRRLRPELEHQPPAGVRRQLRPRARLRRLARPPDDAQGRPEPGAPGRRHHQREREPSVRGAGAGAHQRRPGPEHGHARLPRPAGEVPAPVRRQLLDPERLHLRASRST